MTRKARKRTNGRRFDRALRIAQADQPRRKGSAGPTDEYVGTRIRARRKALGLSQEKLGQALGVSFQQVQKYEIGINRVAAGRLWEIAGALDTPVEFFFPKRSRRARRRAAL